MRKKLLVILLLVVLIVLVVTRCGGKKDQQNDPVDGQGFAQQSGKAELPAELLSSFNRLMRRVSVALSPDIRLAQFCTVALAVLSSLPPQSASLTPTMPPT